MGIVGVYNVACTQFGPAQCYRYYMWITLMIPAIHEAPKNTVFYIFINTTTKRAGMPRPDQVRKNASCQKKKKKKKKRRIKNALDFGNLFINKFGLMYSRYP